jgi:hypothetical protein
MALCSGCHVLYENSLVSKLHQFQQCLWYYKHLITNKTVYKQSYSLRKYSNYFKHLGKGAQIKP